MSDCTACRGWGWIRASYLSPRYWCGRCRGTGAEPIPLGKAKPESGEPIEVEREDTETRQ